MPAFELQFPAERIGPLADTYATSRYGAQDDAALEAGAAARARGCYTRAEFLVVCDWKAPRTRGLVALNDERTVRTTSALALGGDGERERMVMLCTLRGVRTATASALLHAADPDRWPLIDWRALESLGTTARAEYSVDLWLAYRRACRALAVRHGVDGRTLDRALWMYSKLGGTTPACAAA